MGLKVLAVESCPDTRKQLSDTLASVGYEVQIADDGVHCLELLKTQLPQVIITSINMPRMDGISLIKAIRALNSFESLSILVLTTENSNDVKLQARIAGATGWITKPFDPVKLLKALTVIAG